MEESMTNTVEAFCKRLYELAMATGEKSTASEGEEERSGNYISGYRDNYTYATLEFGHYSIKATQRIWKIFSVSSDSKGIDFRLEVSRDKNVVFEAQRDGPENVKKFAGNDERYLGSDSRDGTNWKITKGELAPDILALAPEKSDDAKKIA